MVRITRIHSNLSSRQICFRHNLISLANAEYMFLIKPHICSHCRKYKVAYYLIGTNGCIEHVSEDLSFAREVKLI